MEFLGKGVQIPAADILRGATGLAAEAVGMANDIGTLAPGKLADMVVVDGLFHQAAFAARSPHLGRMNVLSGAPVSLDFSITPQARFPSLLTADVTKQSLYDVMADAHGDYYFLWSLERVAVIYDLKDIGGKDWYGWGSEVILQNQRVDGAWQETHGDINDTCFALLFLTRANLAKDLTESIRTRGGKVALP